MTDEKGETFFVGKDIAVALGYTNPQKAIRDHVDDEDKRVCQNRHTLFFIAKPRLSQARALLCPKFFVPLDQVF